MVIPHHIPSYVAHANPIADRVERVQPYHRDDLYRKGEIARGGNLGDGRERVYEEYHSPGYSDRSDASSARNESLPTSTQLFQHFFEPYQKELTMMHSFFKAAVPENLPSVIHWDSISERSLPLAEQMLELYEMNSYCVITMKGIRCDYMG